MEEKALSIFETILITKPDLTIKEVDEFRAKLTDLFSSFSNREIKYKEMGTKKLAYTVKSYSTGRYFMFTYPATTENIKHVEHEFRADDLILKFITVEQDKMTYDLDDFPIITEHKTKEDRYDALDIIFGSKEIDTRTRTKKTHAVHTEDITDKAFTWVYVVSHSSLWIEDDKDMNTHAMVFSDFDTAEKEFMVQAKSAIDETKEYSPHDPDFWHSDITTAVNRDAKSGEFRVMSSISQVTITLEAQIIN